MKFPKIDEMKLKWLYIFLLLNLSLWGQGESVDYGIGKLVIDNDGLPAKPPLSVQKQHSVYDYAGLLSPEERRRLEEKLSKYYDSTSTQIVVATLNRVNDDISLYATEWAHKWGIGQKDKGNGIFILVSKDDHKITIRTGYGVEHLLTDALSRRVIENDIIPAFRQGRFYEGLDRAITTIQKILSGEFVNDLPQGEEIPLWVILLFILFIFFVFWLLAKNSGGDGWSSNNGGPIIITRGGRSTWGPGGGSFGGGGFGGSFGGGFSGGFGGGGFGGGGATGGW